jgi:transposase
MLGKECPMCGESMRLDDRQRTERVPGTNQSRTYACREWSCPECDYFEEADEETPKG